MSVPTEHMKYGKYSIQELNIFLDKKNKQLEYISFPFPRDKQNLIIEINAIKTIIAAKISHQTQSQEMNYNNALMVDSKKDISGVSNLYGDPSAHTYEKELAQQNSGKIDVDEILKKKPNKDKNMIHQYKNTKSEKHTGEKNSWGQEIDKNGVWLGGDLDPGELSRQPLSGNAFLAKAIHQHMGDPNYFPPNKEDNARAKHKKANLTTPQYQTQSRNNNQPQPQFPTANMNDSVTSRPWEDYELDEHDFDEMIKEMNNNSRVEKKSSRKPPPRH